MISSEETDCVALVTGQENHALHSSCICIWSPPAKPLSCYQATEEVDSRSMVANHHSEKKGPKKKVTLTSKVGFIKLPLMNLLLSELASASCSICSLHMSGYS